MLKTHSNSENPSILQIAERTGLLPFPDHHRNGNGKTPLAAPLAAPSFPPASAWVLQLIKVTVSLAGLWKNVMNIWYVIYDMRNMIYDMIWHDTMGYGLVWNDMIWNDMTWYEYMIWYDMICHDMTWHDMKWNDMIWHGMIWYGMIWFDMQSSSTAQGSGGSFTIGDL